MTVKEVLVNFLNIKNTTVDFGKVIKIVGETTDNEEVRFLIGKEQIEISVDGEVHEININEITTFYAWDYYKTYTEIVIKTKFSDIRFNLKTGEVEEDENEK